MTTITLNDHERVTVVVDGTEYTAEYTQKALDEYPRVLDLWAEQTAQRAQAERWGGRWKRAAKHHRNLARGAEWGLRNEIANNRTLMDALAEMDDRRPIEGDTETQAYIEDLRGRLQVQQMYNVDLERTIESLRAALASLRSPRRGKGEV